MPSTEGETQTVWICRHANRIDFVDRSWRGDDPHLSPDGIVQAKETGDRLVGEGIQHIFASPFLRTVETAHYIAEALGLSVKIEHGASEWLNPEWFSVRPEHIPVDALIERFPRVDPNHKSVVIPGYPEGSEEAFARAGRAARELADTHIGDILLIGHGHSVHGMADGLVGTHSELSVGLCSLVKIVRENGTARIELDGDSSHLSSGDLHRNRLV
ncbi:MAG: histidine phosphatase family protein [Candidatus Latescibacteria bacterium]|nr:histidine phosphatase family protein [Candidatus Latescibacterota bacterium]